MVDDGSTTPSEHLPSLPWTVSIRSVRIANSGASTARNIGLHLAVGALVLFVDSDCYLDESALMRLVAAAEEHPQDKTFQLRITGNILTVVGTAEEIRQSSVQKTMLQTDGRIMWLNTAGFAVRRDFANQLGELFDKRARRSQDTLLMARLLRYGQLPRYVPDSIVSHAPPLSSLRYVLKAYSAARHSRPAYALIAAMGVTVTANGKQRRQIWQEMSTKASQMPHGRAAFCVLLAREALNRIARLLTRRATPRTSNGDVNQYDQIR